MKSVPAGKRGQAGAAITLDGVQFDIGWKPTGWLDVGAYAGRRWTEGWRAGARAGVAW